MVLNLNIKYREAECDGVWAWDCEHKEPILIFPTVLTLISLQRSRSVSEMQNTTQNQSKSFGF